MGTIGESLAAQFEQANADLIAAVEGMGDARWGARTPNEQWPVGVVAHHVAVSHPGIVDVVIAIAEGRQLPPFTQEMVDRGNTQHARENANCTREETLALLRENGGAAAEIVRAIPDEGFARTASLLGREMSAQQAAEMILIGHPRSHLASIQAAV
jgi:hypothetical protein